MNRIRVEIGGIGILFRCKNCGIKIQRHESYIKDFICAGNNNLPIDVEIGELPDYSKEKKLFEAKENWCLYQDGRRYIFELFGSPKRINGGIIGVCFLEKVLSKGELHIGRKTEDMVVGRNFSLDQVMRILGHLITVSVLHRYDGILVHSAGIILNGEGIIFSGISGAGKTTISRLWQKRGDVTLLSDDRIIIRKENGQYFVYGTPWPGEGRASSSEKAPLKRVLFLSKAAQNTLILIEKKEALRRLVTQCFPALWDRRIIDFAIKFCAELVGDIPCFSFGFVPNESAVEFIEKNC